MKVHLKEDGDCRDLLGVCLVAMAEVTAVRQIQGHDTLMWLQQSCVHLHVCRQLECLGLSGGCLIVCHVAATKLLISAWDAACMLRPDWLHVCMQLVWLGLSGTC